MGIFLKGFILTTVLLLFAGQQTALALPAEKIPWVIFVYGIFGYAVVGIIIGALVGLPKKTK